MLIGYMRPNQGDPQCSRQLESLKKAGCGLIISEDHPSAKNRIQLENALRMLKYSDKIVVEKLFVLADSTRHLGELIEEIKAKGAFLKSISEGIDMRDSDSYSFGDIVSHIVAFQSDLISERTKEGLCEAKEKGIATGRPRKPDENVRRAIGMYQSKKYSLADIKDATGISKSTLYRYLEHCDSHGENRES